MLGNGRIVANGSQQGEPVQLRHHHVRQDQRRTQAPRGVERLTAIRDRVHLVSAAQQVPEVLTHVGVVVGHDNQFTCRGRLRR